jgi:hypothetical protein
MKVLAESRLTIRVGIWFIWFCLVTLANQAFAFDSPGDANDSNADIVFNSSKDGRHLWALRDGKMLWQVDLTKAAFQSKFAVNEPKIIKDIHELTSSYIPPFSIEPPGFDFRHSPSHYLYVSFVRPTDGEDEETGFIKKATGEYLGYSAAIDPDTKTVSFVDPLTKIVFHLDPDCHHLSASSLNGVLLWKIDTLSVKGRNLHIKEISLELLPLGPIDGVQQSNDALIVHTIPSLAVGIDKRTGGIGIGED